MNTNMPDADRSEISVLIPHYNNVVGLARSLESLASTNLPLDVVVVDDGSASKPNEDSLRKIYPRTKLLFLPENKGIEEALNCGLNYIFNTLRSRYIARLDCEDRCRPDRFQIQRDFLEAHPDVFLLGSWVRFVSPEGKFLWNYCPETEDSAIRKKMFVNNMFIHPSVMFRADVFQKVGVYTNEFPRTEDYALFFKILQFYKAANIPEYLVETVHSFKGISVIHYKQQLRSRMRVICRYFDFSFWAFYGLARNALLWLAPFSVTQQLKIVFKRHNRHVDRS